MDPVSRRLAAAAMGIAFGLSRDEELEKTRLDLERARMEREDFRNGAAPDTGIMHLKLVSPTDYEKCYKDREIAQYTMRTKAEVIRKMWSEDYSEMREDLDSARSLLAKVVRENITERRNLSEPIVNGIVRHFWKAHIDDDEVAEIANDDLGDVSIGLDLCVSTDEDSDSTMNDE